MSDLSLLSSRAIRGMYFARLETDPGTNWLDGVSNYFGSDQSSETYNFLGQTPMMREWIGQRQAKGFTGNGLTIINKHYEATLEIQKKDARRDKTGQIRARIDEFADRSQTHWASLTSTLIVNGVSSLCYDGQYFYDTDHVEGDSGVQSNKIGVAIAGLPCVLHGTPANPSTEEMQQAIIKAIVQILSFKDDKGEPMNENATSFTVMVPLGLMQSALAAVSTLVPAMSVQNLNPNLLRNFKVEVVLNVRLTAAGWTNQFTVFRTDSPIKALIRQTEQEVEMKMKAEGSEFEFDNDAWQMGIDAWRGAGYGYWQRSVHVTLN
ncbi:Mu-like prophage major head subunit gpT family protein [Bradyrhizobium xenonodulans]|uniref:Mu-like prophage major head subunit gpT family protein n=1 Tax=Bradyrhizobium xenonodulans TaxID=2736875 RepID=A0ABY7MDJ7_9BRAD|nr:Mu-like prophage major head subunit gpT family protein [Bradyrhizobium xenonodulans]WBL75603.1 Mu-like prophage major head subunit gpT family protein [Bradyrhizobium xenonodulans]